MGTSPSTPATKTRTSPQRSLRSAVPLLSARMACQCGRPGAGSALPYLDQASIRGVGKQAWVLQTDDSQETKDEGEVPASQAQSYRIARSLISPSLQDLPESPYPQG